MPMQCRWQTPSNKSQKKSVSAICPWPSWRFAVQPNIFHWHSALQFLTQAVRCIETSEVFFQTNDMRACSKKTECSSIYRRQNRFPFDCMLQPAKLVRQLEVGWFIPNSQCIRKCTSDFQNTFYPASYAVAQCASIQTEEKKWPANGFTLYTSWSAAHASNRWSYTYI